MSRTAPPHDHGTGAQFLVVAVMSFRTIESTWLLVSFGTLPTGRGKWSKR